MITNFLNHSITL